MKNNLLYIIIFTAGLSIRAESYNGGYHYFLFGRQPSARVEAMGKGGVALSKDGYSPFYNPALLHMSDGQLNINGSYAEPYYLAENAKYFYYSLTHIIDNRIAYSFSSNNCLLWNRSYIYDAHGRIIESFVPLNSFYTATFSANPAKLFSIGMSISIFDENCGKNYDLYAIPLIDIGLGKEIAFLLNKRMHSKILFASSLFNIFNVKMKERKQKLDIVLPVIFRVGFSYEISIKNNWFLKNLNFIQFILHGEYQDLFNYRFITAYRTGFELGLINLIFLRLGYYSETNKKESSISKNKFNDFTYGFGIKLPSSKIFKSHLIPSVCLDFTSLKQPTYVTYINDWENFYSISLTLSFNFISYNKTDN